MTAQRLIQNFRQSRCILWAAADFNAEILERTLLKLGAVLLRIEEVDLTALDHNRDILFIDGDQPFNPTMLMGVGAALPPAPTIGIVGVEAPSRLKLLAEIGVTAFLRKPIHASEIYSALFLGVNNYGRLRSMEARLAEHDRRRYGRRFVIKAVVGLVQHHGMTDDEAFAELRRESMRQRLGLEEFCAAVLANGSGTFPARWPATRVADAPSHRPGEHSNATHVTDRCSDDVAAGSDVRQGGGPDQARRA
jgi:AmiR/NasT family two-component response regulator